MESRLRDNKGRFVKIENVEKGKKKQSRVMPKTKAPSTRVAFTTDSQSGDPFTGLISKGISFKQLRALARSNDIVRIAINIIKHSVTKAPWIIRAKDKDKTEALEEQIEYVKKLLGVPNPNNDTFRTLFSKVCEDVLVLDQGVTEKVSNPLGEIVELYHVDGATIRPRIDGAGLFGDPAYVQILPDSMGKGKFDAKFKKDELMVVQINPSGEVGKVGYGESPVEAVIMTVVTSLQAMTYNANYFDDSRMPPFVANLKGVASEDLVAFKNEFEAQLQGKPWKAAWTNADNLKLEKFRDSNMDMQFMDLSIWFARIVFGAFELSPQEVGFTMDINKATAEVQERILKQRGVANVQVAIAERINLDIITELALFDPRFAEIEFAWDAPDKIEAKTQAETDEIYLRTGKVVINELRQRDGEDKVEWGDTPSVRVNPDSGLDDPDQAEDTDDLDSEKKDNPKPKKEEDVEKDYEPSDNFKKTMDKWLKIYK